MLNSAMDQPIGKKTIEFLDALPNSLGTFLIYIITILRSSFPRLSLSSVYWISLFGEIFLDVYTLNTDYTTISKIILHDATGLGLPLDLYPTSASRHRWSFTKRL